MSYIPEVNDTNLRFHLCTFNIRIFGEDTNGIVVLVGTIGYDDWVFQPASYTILSREVLAECEKFVTENRP